MRLPLVATASLSLVTLMMIAPIASGDGPARPGGDERLQATFRDYLNELFRREPLTATSLGDHSHDDRLDDIEPAARKATLDFKRATLETLSREIDPATLSADGRVDLDIFRNALTRDIWLAENFKPFEEDPRVYGDYTTGSVYLLLTQSSLPKDANLAHAMARMEQIPRILSVARRTITSPPKVVTETAIRQAEGAVAFYTTELFELAGQKPGEGPLGAKAAALVPAIKAHVEFLKKEVLPRAGENWRIGREKFARKLEMELDSGLGADEVLAEARREANRVQREMEVIARQAWGTLFPGKVIPTDDPAGRRELVRRVLEKVADDHGTAETLVDEARATVGDIKAFIRDRKILALPEPDQCRIIAMPEFMRGNSVAYLNPAPPLDARGSSEYAISPPPADWSKARADSLLREYNRAMLKILTIHEAYPGHYVQLEYSNRCPSLVRKVLSSGTFAEGWAVYTEQMMLDQGFGDGDLGLRLNQLKFYLRAVVNAILDHEMHAGTMTDDQALDLLMNRAYQTEGEAVGKIIRSKQSSCQLSTYFVGRMAFYRLRQAIQAQQGESFDLARYHEAALSHGTIPVKHLPALVRRTLALPAEDHKPGL
ncbi:hypothetical protein OJF2_67690 [Aquisphaera giovannonii]|uniref:DUF885 domain-containing protein n=1 Tax=Aquisphaera giovannonii TaxID=406548 RepID=A0A5B9WDX7_9BACT|nr:DUF885 domain-containing protein [Aquisphaera giovannonii]QEH38171.1 hypothetical protein OJF2_67690 [Aquisphaera giovannonii]